MAHIEVTRGGEREAVHPFTAVMAEDTEVRWSVGEPVNTFWRSASKPFQLLNSLLSMNPSDIAGLDAESLAVGAASHSGQKEHVERVQMLLQRFGLAEDQLQCGAHPPMHEASAKAVSEPTAIHNNCSGKHTFMLAACAAQGWPLDHRHIRFSRKTSRYSISSPALNIASPSMVVRCRRFSRRCRQWSSLSHGSHRP